MQHSQTRTFAILSIAGAVALTGCGSSSKSGSAGLGTSAAATSGAAAATSGAAATGGASSGAIKIGFEGPLSGPNAQLGINEVDAVKLAVAEANKNNTYGFQVTLVTSDDAGLAANAPAAATALQQDPAILGVIGPSFSGPTSATGASYDAADLVLISPSATNPTLTSSGFKSFHRVVPPDSLEGKEAADWLAKKSKKVFVIDDLSAYGKGAGDAVQAELKVDKIATDRQGVAATTTDYSVIAQTVVSSGDTALFYGGYDAQAALFAKALVKAGYKGLTMTGNGGKSSVFVSGAGAAGNGWYFSCGCLDATVAPAAKQFSADYSAMWKTPPSTYSPEAFDATNAMLTAIKAAGASPTRKSVFAAVNALDYTGITTTVKFLPNGEVSQQVINLYLEKAGVIGLVGDILKQS